MKTALLQIAGVVGAVWCIAALSARNARAKAKLEHKEQEERANERVDKVIRATNTLDRVQCLDRLRGGSGK